MAGQKSIEIKFDAFGNTKIDAQGFVGNSCAVETGAYLNVLRGDKTDETKKPEYYQPNTSASEVKARW